MRIRPEVRHLQRVQKLRPNQKAVGKRGESRLFWSSHRIRWPAFKAAQKCNREPPSKHCRRWCYHRLSPNRLRDRKTDHGFPNFQAGQRRLRWCRHVFRKEPSGDASKVHRTRRHSGGGGAPWPAVSGVSRRFSERNVAAPAKLPKLAVDNHSARMQVRQCRTRLHSSNQLVSALPAIMCHIPLFPNNPPCCPAAQLKSNAFPVQNTSFTSLHKSAPYECTACAMAAAACCWISARMSSFWAWTSPATLLTLEAKTSSTSMLAVARTLATLASKLTHPSDQIVSRQQPLGDCQARNV